MRAVLGDGLVLECLSLMSLLACPMCPVWFSRRMGPNGVVVVVEFEFLYLRLRLHEFCCVGAVSVRSPTRRTGAAAHELDRLHRSAAERMGPVDPELLHDLSVEKAAAELQDGAVEGQCAKR